MAPPPLPFPSLSSPAPRDHWFQQIYSHTISIYNESHLCERDGFMPFMFSISDDEITFTLLFFFFSIFASPFLIPLSHSSSARTLMWDLYNYLPDIPFFSWLLSFFCYFLKGRLFFCPVHQFCPFRDSLSQELAGR